jgi:hypothetical protein
MGTMMEELMANRDRIFTLLNEAENIRGKLCVILKQPEEGVSTRDTSQRSPSPAFNLGSPAASTIYLQNRSRVSTVFPSRGSKVSEQLESILPSVTSSTHRKALIAIDQNGLGSVKFKKGFSALHWASKVGNSQVVKYLLTKGADPEAKDDCGKTPQDYADHEGEASIIFHHYNGKRLREVVNLATLPVPHRRALEAIEKHGWKSVKWGGGWTVLHWAHQVDRWDVIKYCKSIGVSPNLLDDKGHPPVYYSARNN